MLCETVLDRPNWVSAGTPAVIGGGWATSGGDSNSSQ